MPVFQWFRIVHRSRESREDVLKSGPGRFHEDSDREPTTYAADSLMTAWREVSAHLGVVEPDATQFRGWQVRVDDPQVVDFRTPEARGQFGISENELKGDPAPPKCLEVGRAARGSREGHHGLIYDSLRRPGGTCAAFFLERADEKIELVPVTEEEWKKFLKDIG